MANDSSSLPPRRLASLTDDDLEEGQFVPAAYHSSSDTDTAPPLQRRPGRLSLKAVLALGRGEALPSPTPSSESDGTTISDDDGNPSPASVFRMMEPKNHKRVAVALDAGWAATGKRGWAGGKLAAVVAAAAAAAEPTLNSNPQSSSHSNVSGDSSSSAQAVAVHLNQTPAPPLPFAEQAQLVHLHHQPVAAQLPHQLVVPQRAAASADQPPRRVYTCKECGRTFPTNQALGGHAAGHRSRQREAEAAAAAAGMMQELGEDGAAAFLAALRRSRREEAPHECRKCHKVFATGVALGGHMRVHYIGPPIVPARRNKKRCLAPALQPVEDMAAAAAAAGPPPDLSLALSIKTEEAPSLPAPAGGVRAVRLFGIDISPQVQLAPSEQQCSGRTTGDYSSAGGQQ